MNKPITIKEIARDLGVSFSTVSKSLNDSSEISEKTKKKVKEYAALRGYTPNQIALSLKNSATYTIGVIIPDIQNSFFASVLKNIEIHAKSYGYRIVTFFTNETLKEEEESLKILSKGLVDGLIVCPSDETFKKKKFDHFNAIKNMNTPVLIFDRVDDNLEFDSVSVDDYKSIISALDYLYEKGARDIVLASAIPDVSVGKKRKEAFEKFITDNPEVNGTILEADDNTVLKSMLYEALDTKKVDAVLGVDIESTSLANAVVSMLGKTYKEEISLIGYVNKQFNRLIHPRVSYINQYPEKIGQIAVDMIVDKIKIGNSKLLNKEVIETTLAIKDTSR
ncbi:LacI family DNA-binding transcriptional regulator [Neptunitalea lumnitzerae]|uniref:LacI family transcriptional regulator n=1 Tax=Neptunitalea lumnitzerae TaxID=2965509 RepID=A0ABQ5MMG7_9FLAO|nr:LacI family DNA-binding transcriptional regulator [Neptunitalea sp. Y10]GLB50569.1 LacI family transcriptional regulator [Neptunitalea sp. Y10]